MSNFTKSFLAAALGLMILPTLCLAHGYKVGDLIIGHPWARATVGSAANGAAYLAITNNGARADRLVKVSTPWADSAELHANVVENGVTGMRPVTGVELAPGTTVELKPSGLHVMLMGLKEPLKVGTLFPMTLTFEKAGELNVEVKVEPIATTDPGRS